MKNAAGKWLFRPRTRMNGQCVWPVPSDVVQAFKALMQPSEATKVQGREMIAAGFKPMDTVYPFGAKQ